MQKKIVLQTPSLSIFPFRPQNKIFPQSCLVRNKKTIPDSFAESKIFFLFIFKNLTRCPENKNKCKIKYRRSIILSIYKDLFIFEGY